MDVAKSLKNSKTAFGNQDRKQVGWEPPKKIQFFLAEKKPAALSSFLKIFSLILFNMKLLYTPKSALLIPLAPRVVCFPATSGKF